MKQKSILHIAELIPSFKSTTSVILKLDGKELPCALSLDDRDQVSVRLTTKEHLSVDIRDHQLSASLYFNDKWFNSTMRPTSYQQSIDEYGRQASYIFDVYEFRQSEFQEDAQHYIRKAIPVHGNTNFFKIIQDETFESDQVGSSRGLLSVNIDNCCFDIYIIKIGKEPFLIIDSSDAMSIEQFEESVWSISVALGYLLGHLIQDAGYVFCYDSSAMKDVTFFNYRQLRRSIKTMYEPVNANPYARCDNKQVADELYPKFQLIQQGQLETLSQIVHKEVDIKSILLLIIESMRGSLLSMPAGLSVALEGLGDYLYQQNEEKINPISSKATRNEIRARLLNVLDDYESHPDVVNFPLLRSKILDINRPSNADTLMIPFRVLGIDLHLKNVEAIKYRNDFLHGNLNLTAKTKGNGKKYEMSVYEIVLRLYTSLNLAFMRLCGFSGLVSNFAVLNIAENQTSDEPYYFEI